MAADRQAADLRSALRIWQRLRGFVRPHRARLAGAAGLTLVFAAADLLKPWPVKVVVDQVLLGRDWAALPAAWRGAEHGGTLLAVAIGALLLLGLLSGVANYFATVLLADSGQRIVAKVRKEALASVLEQSLSWHEDHRRGDLMVRLVGDVASLRTLLVDGLFSLGRESLLVVGTLAMIACLDWQLALATVAVLPLVAWVTALVARRLRTASQKQRRKEGEIAAACHEALGSVPVIQAYGLADAAVRRFAKQNRKCNRSGLAATRLEGRLGVVTDLAVAVGTGLTLLLGVLRARQGVLSPGELVVLLTYVRSFYRPIRKGLGRSAAMVKAAACGERVVALLDAAPDLAVPASPVRLPAVRGELRLQGVRFAHRDGTPVLRGIDLTVAAGSVVALTGGNGAGKTTLATLLPRLRDPQAGSVQLDGHDLRQLDLAQLRAAVALVFQDTVLFEGTLRDNLLLAGPDATPAELEEAAAAAGLHEVAARLPDGLDTDLGEHGKQMSGGERQRLALARALLRRAAVYVLDEPTTGLDRDAHLRFTRLLRQNLRGRTVVLVTHDQRLLADCDRVLRLHDGVLHDETAAAHPGRGGAA